MPSSPPQPIDRIMLLGSCFLHTILRGSRSFPQAPPHKRSYRPHDNFSPWQNDSYNPHNDSYHPRNDSYLSQNRSYAPHSSSCLPRYPSYGLQNDSYPSRNVSYEPSSQSAGFSSSINPNPPHHHG